jgi:hypothetical protein
VELVLAMGQQVFRVVVRSNMVVEIQTLEVDVDVLDASLEDTLTISTILANNNKINGKLDGDYDLGSFETARHFAALCLGYQKQLCEKSIESLTNINVGDSGVWTNKYIPTSKCE